MVPDYILLAMFTHFVNLSEQPLLSDCHPIVTPVCFANDIHLYDNLDYLKTNATRYFKIKKKKIQHDIRNNFFTPYCFVHYRITWPANTTTFILQIHTWKQDHVKQNLSFDKSPTAVISRAKKKQSYLLNFCQTKRMRFTPNRTISNLPEKSGKCFFFTW